MDKLNLKVWLLTARLQTLPLLLAPIITGTALAYISNNKVNYLVLFLSLITGSLLQVLANFANDLGDDVKQADLSDRIGPLRAIQIGMISRQRLKNAVYSLAWIAFICGIGLIIVAWNTWYDGLFFLSLGILAIIAAINYTVGKNAYGYLGFGDLSVFIFFGLVAVGGSYYLQTHYLNLWIILPSLGCGFFAVAVLNINNLRDIEQDIKVNKKTLVVRIGYKNAVYYHCFLILAGFSCYLFFTFYNYVGLSNLLFLLVSPFLCKHMYLVLKNKEPQTLNSYLIQMIRLSLAINILFSLGLVLS